MMGINFKQTTHGKVGDIIYPAYNNTNGFWIASRWDLVTLVNKDGEIMDRVYIHNYATVNAIELIQKYPKIIKLETSTSGCSAKKGDENEI